MKYFMVINYAMICRPDTVICVQAEALSGAGLITSLGFFVLSSLCATNELISAGTFTVASLVGLAVVI